ncbi:MAG: pseudouridine synthase [Chloroflexi bacterium]|nr:pseudouridine synthase [Chloroflexota bacterium]
MPEERLQKILAAAGVASRRASEALIASGRVRVNGRVATIGAQVDPATAQIEVDGFLVGVGAARTYVALHKPAGVTSTTQDRHADTTVLDLVPTALTPDGTRLYPVGRLDRDSEGLLLLTNDGTWADRVLHPRFGVQREYAVGLARPLDRDQLAILRAGIALDEGLATFAAPLRLATPIETRTLAELLHPPPHPDLVWYRAVIAQGWKRQLRRMFAVTGNPVLRLVRVRIGTVRLDRLSTGRARLLRAPEIRQLGMVPGAALRRPAAPVEVSARALRHPGPSGAGAFGQPGAGPVGAKRTVQKAPEARHQGAKAKPKTAQLKGAPGSSGPRRPAPKPSAVGVGRVDPAGAADSQKRGKGQRRRPRSADPARPVSRRPTSRADKHPAHPPDERPKGRADERPKGRHEGYPPGR